MQRLDLIHALETVEPARASATAIPLLCHYWFRGDRLMCFNDYIGIQIDFKTTFKGAVPGDLLSLLHAGNKKEVDIQPKGDGEGTITLTYGDKDSDSKIRLATMSESACDKTFSFPKFKSEDELELVSGGAFLDALTDCLRSVGSDTSIPDQRGVTLLVHDDDYVRLYSTNDKIMSGTEVQVKSRPRFGRVILSSIFCKQLLRLAAKDEFEIYIAKDYAIAMIGMDVMLYGAIIHTNSPIPFPQFVDRYRNSALEQLVPWPLIGGMIERAQIIAGTGAEEVQTEITVQNGLIKFNTSGKFMEAKDDADIDKRHEDVALRVSIKWLRQAYDELRENTQLAFLHDGIVIMHEPPAKKGKARGGLVFIIATGK